MKKLFVALIVVAMTFSAGISTVEAKRMGGGGSFGKKSQSMNRQATPPQAAKPAAAAAAPAAAGAAGAAAAAKPSMWKGMLGGALLGLGLGALLSSMGLGGAMAGMISNMIMIALFAFAAMFIYKLVRRKMANGSAANNGMRPAFATAAPSSFTPEIASRIEQPMQRTAFDAAPATAAVGAAATGAAWGVPVDFDTAGFLRHAKTYFLRLQAAWDKADSNDISEFTTPEMFAELRMQLQERGASENHTDVVTLDAQLLGIDTVDNDYLASVRFTGMIKEDENMAAAPFSEIWNLSKPTEGQGGWILAGIEQEEKTS
ncbi:putative membrane protein [Collimonas arenae]|uniref:Putative membrane protein n=1 Tax=Collimonas arenae TaxID=279058 RepID=A0A0A1FKR9_9BURK|nr:TIM44-like domain-containing protein [Collimonas arenae]AIY43522.1 putative membrane protein [Collimonas arenae]